MCWPKSHSPKRSPPTTFPTPLQTQTTLYFSLTYILKSITSSGRKEELLVLPLKQHSVTPEAGPVHLGEAIGVQGPDKRPLYEEGNPLPVLTWLSSSPAAFLTLTHINKLQFVKLVRTVKAYDYASSRLGPQLSPDWGGQGQGRVTERPRFLVAHDWSDLAAAAGLLALC